MYSCEIDKLLQGQNYNINSETYINICSTSPQITRIKYNPNGNHFEIWVSDRYWKFTVHRKEEQIL